MIAPGEHAFQLICIGLQPNELKLAEKISAQLGGTLESASDDMDVLSRAQTGSVPVCIIGQSDSNPEPSYIAWLLKGIINPSKIILIYSSLSDEEVQKLNRFGASNVLTRQIDPRQLARITESALAAREERKESFFSTISHFFPFRKQSAAQ